MATYAIGDIQGCFDQLQALLERLAFDPARDRLWFTGDLVNRGPKSLDTLRFVRDLGEGAATVLGNHDLHMLAVAAGQSDYSRSDTFHDVLEAPDADELLNWLRHRPLLHHDAELGHTLVHAGLPPQWDLATAQGCAAELESVLRGPEHVAFLHDMYGNKPKRWAAELQGMERLRFSLNCFTRMRYCTREGKLDFKHKGAPGSQPAELLPWFEIPGRRSAGLKLVFGHWSTLGLRAGDGLFGLDTGCLWGGRLTAVCLEDGRLNQLDCPGARKPGRN